MERLCRGIRMFIFLEDYMNTSSLHKINYKLLLYSCFIILSSIYAENVSTDRTLARGWGIEKYKPLATKSPKSSVQSISYLKLYRFATSWEYILIFLGIFFTIIKAIVLPITIIVYSEFCTLLVERTRRIGTNSKTFFLPLFGGGKILTDASAEENEAELYNDSMAYGITLSICCIMFFICGVIAVDAFNLAALKQVTQMRIRFFRTVMRQDIGWHDKFSDQNFAVKITDDMEKIRDGMSEKVAHFLNLLIDFGVMIVIAFIYGWKLTLAVSIYIPIVFITNYLVMKYQSKLSIKESNSYSKAGNLVEEILAGIRTVVAFGGEKKEADRYDSYLVPARRAGQRKGAFSGMGDGIVHGLLFISCACVFWYGINLIIAERELADKEYTPAIIMIAFLGLIIGADNISNIPPFLEAFAIGRGSATNVFKVIDSKSKIDPMSLSGIILKNGVKGDIEFEDIFFKYPSRDDIIVLRGLNIKIESGQTVALVGTSGCGKSTCLQLMQRFYDPIFGNILLDGLDIRKYNIAWLRSNIAIVGQEPVLFAGTIGENISFGKTKATQKEIEEAARSAGVHDFIAELPNSYQTIIGEKGAQLSGGQKQRIAIARALIQNPRILLLDEATSALDYQSERLVQEALDMARKGRTTLVVSHRLSAIKSSDKIIFIDNGKAIEEGTHEELMNLKGRYHDMVTAGGIKLDEPDVEDEHSKSLSISEKSSELDSADLQESLTPEESNDIPIIIDRKKKQKKKKQKKQKKNEGEESQLTFGQTFKRILKVAKPEWPILILGFICSALFGCSYPSFAILFGEFCAALAITEKDDALEATSTIAISCVAIGIVSGLLCFFQTYLFNLAGVWLTARIRSQAFRSIILQDMGWFDDKKNSVGALAARLSGDAANIQGSIGFPLSAIIQSITNFTLGVSIAFFYSWKLALICLSTVPFIVGSVVYEAKFMANSTIREKQILEEASKIATEAIINIRTVAGLRKEPDMIARYCIEIEKVESSIKKKLRFRGLVNSFGQSFPYFGYAVGLYYGGILVSQNEVEFQDIIKVSETLLYGSIMLGQSLAFIPAFTTALVAGRRLFRIIDRAPQIQSPDINTSNRRKSSKLSLGVKYEDIYFRYPTRRDVPILQGLNLEIPEGKTVALVGHSGCGKSTCIQLLQRLYDPDSGKIFIDNDEIRTELSLDDLRNKLGIVSQEPVLFERTIAENIAFGDNSRDVSFTEIVDVAIMANIHTFITKLPLGYDTNLGSRGTQLSGGQKQRIAIARALIRNPKILLLDEATSALDLQSEKVVQTALDAARSGRTCIVIAHRLSTVQNADIICVLQNGDVVEQGSHKQLLANNGIYAILHRTQPDIH